MSAHKGNKYSQKGSEPMDSNLHCRMTTTNKNKFKAQAKKDGYKSVCEWITKTLLDRVRS